MGYQIFLCQTNDTGCRCHLLEASVVSAVADRFFFRINTCMTNLAAWDECLRRGGLYADSARLWALKDSLALLRRMNCDAWSVIRAELPQEIDVLLTQLGGETAPPGDGALAVLAPLGLAEHAQSYEILALYLAAQMPV